MNNRLTSTDIISVLANGDIEQASREAEQEIIEIEQAAEIEEAEEDKPSFPMGAHVIASMLLLIEGATSVGLDSPSNLRRMGYHSIFMLIAAGTLSSVSWVGLNEDSLVVNTHHLYRILNRKLPIGWERLPYYKEIAAITLTCLPILIGVASHAGQRFFYVTDLPDNYPGLNDLPEESLLTSGIILSTTSGIIFFITQGIGLYELFRSFFTKNSLTYPSKVTCFSSHILGNTIGLLGYLIDWVGMYLTMKYTGQKSFPYNDDEMHATKYFYIAGSAISSIPTFFFLRSFFIQVLNQFFTSFKFRIKEMSPTGIALCLGILLSLLEKQSTTESFDEVFTDLHINPMSGYNILLESVSWTIISYLTLITTASLYDPLFKITMYSLEKLKSFYEKIKQKSLGDSHDESTLTLVNEQPSERFTWRKNRFSVFVDNNLLRPDNEETPPVKKSRHHCPCTLY